MCRQLEAATNEKVIKSPGPEVADIQTDLTSDRQVIAPRTNGARVGTRLIVTHPVMVVQYQNATDVDRGPMILIQVDASLVKRAAISAARLVTTPGCAQFPTVDIRGIVGVTEDLRLTCWRSQHLSGRKNYPVGRNLRTSPRLTTLTHATVRLRV
uniref:(northern house mosquito) hypothetical protein n=1 Tax=Culex pipiens TaxID=7175 RepID=A0A8D8A8V6_CULPI